MPDRSPTPARPEAVPEAAEWNPEVREWLAGVRDDQGRWQGEVVGYRSDGTRASVQHFQEGELHGASLRYHPNGEVARRVRYVSGKPEGELRATASTEASPERLRICCVPNNAWSLVEHYTDGLLLDQWFEDDQGRRLLSDGTLRPQHPASVPREARFDESSRRWYQGHSVLKLGRQGLWRWWSETGDLLEEREFEAGQLMGAARVERVAPATFDDARISAWSGHFEAGQRSGRWQFFDADGRAIFERDFGTPSLSLDAEHPVFREQLQDPLALFEELSQAGHVGLGLCALARHAAHSGELRALRAALESRTVRLSPLASQRRVAEYRRQKNLSLATYVQALVDGVEPAVCFSNLAMQLLGRPQVGFDFAVVAVGLNPEHRPFRLSKALLSFELGDPEGAFAEADELETAQPKAAQLIRDYRRILFSRLAFAPSDYSAETPPNPELPQEVNQPLDRVERVLFKYAFRLSKVREALLARLGSEAPWLPPDLSELYASERVELATYTFEESAEDGEEEGDGGVEVIRVDERIDLDSLGTTALLRRARIEWTGLSWLCWAVGLDRVARPEALESRADFGAVLASSLFRVYRVSDSLQTRGLRSKSQGLPSTEWEGSDVDRLEPLFATMAKDEAYEMRAALFFLADERCRSPWQDDLRDG